MIVETKDHYHLYLISQHITDMKGADFTPIDFIRSIIEKQVKGYVKIFADIDEGQKVNGFVVASIIEPIPGKDEVFIDLAWVDPEHNGLALELQEKVEDWARELNITKLSTMIVRGEQAYKKKFGFKREAIALFKIIKPKEVKKNEANKGKD